MANETLICSFTVSDLPKVLDLSHDDLLMVSDYDEQGGIKRCFTRKLEMSALYDAIADDSIISNAIFNSSKAIGKAIDMKLIKSIEDEVRKQLKLDISAIVLLTISANYNIVNDLLDGTLDALLIIDASSEVV